MLEPVARTQKGKRMRRIETSSHRMCKRLLDWCEEARRAGRARRAQALLLLAWRAYDQPPAQGKRGG
jgi:hypothetical protein